MGNLQKKETSIDVLNYRSYIVDKVIGSSLMVHTIYIG
jgi:hypothetical protein